MDAATAGISRRDLTVDAFRASEITLNVKLGADSLVGEAGKFYLSCNRPLMVACCQWVLGSRLYGSVVQRHR